MPEIPTEKLNETAANERVANQIERRNEELERRNEEIKGRDLQELEEQLSLIKDELIELAEVDIEERREGWKRAVELRNERRLQKKQEQNKQQEHERE